MFFHTLISVPEHQANIVNIQNLYPKISVFLIKSHITFPCVYQLPNHAHPPTPHPHSFPWKKQWELFCFDWWPIKRSHGCIFILCSEVVPVQTCRIRLAFSLCSTCEPAAVRISATHTCVRIRSVGSMGAIESAVNWQPVKINVNAAGHRRLRSAVTQNRSQNDSFIGWIPFDGKCIFFMASCFNWLPLLWANLEVLPAAQIICRCNHENSI